MTTTQTSERQPVSALSPFWLTLPAILLLGVAYLFPLTQLLRLSVSDNPAGGLEATGFTWKHYTTFLADPTSARVMVRSLWVALLSTLVALILAMPFATSMVRAKSFMRGLLASIALVPMMTSGVVRAYGLIMVLGQDGPINRSLLALGLVDAPLQILYGPAALIIGNTYFALPFVIFPLAAGIARLDVKYAEAAATLGAAPPRAFYTVTLPLLIPAIAAGSIVAFTLTMTSYVMPGLLGGHGYLVVTTLLGQQMFDLADWVAGAVVSTVLLVTVVLSVLLYQIWLDRKAKFYAAR